MSSFFGARGGSAAGGRPSTSSSAGASGSAYASMGGRWYVESDGGWIPVSSRYNGIVEGALRRGDATTTVDASVTGAPFDYTVRFLSATEAVQTNGSTGRTRTLKRSPLADCASGGSAAGSRPSTSSSFGACGGSTAGGRWYVESDEGWIPVNARYDGIVEGAIRRGDAMTTVDATLTGSPFDYTVHFLSATEAVQTNDSTGRTRTLKRLPIAEIGRWYVESDQGWMPVHSRYDNVVEGALRRGGGLTTVDSSITGSPFDYTVHFLSATEAVQTNDRTGRTRTLRRLPVTDYIWQFHDTSMGYNSGSVPIVAAAASGTVPWKTYPNSELLEEEYAKGGAMAELVTMSADGQPVKIDMRRLVERNCATGETRSIRRVKQDAAQAGWHSRTPSAPSAPMAAAANAVKWDEAKAGRHSRMAAVANAVKWDEADAGSHCRTPSVPSAPMAAGANAAASAEERWHCRTPSAPSAPMAAGASAAASAAGAAAAALAGGHSCKRQT